MTKENLIIDDADLEKLKEAVILLESPTITSQMSNLMSSLGDYIIPNKVSSTIEEKMVSIAENALNSVFSLAHSTMEPETQPSSPIIHKIAAGTVGAVGGFFGMATTLIELPVSTTIMMRSILDIAREEGFPISDNQTKIECIKVFGLEGNLSTDDDNAESGYYKTRASLSAAVNAAAKAANEAAAKAAKEAAAKAAEDINNKAVGEYIIKLIQTVAKTFGLHLTEKAAAKSIPFIGAVAGATLNAMFTDFYQDKAKGHFTVRKLEKKYSEEIIEAHYQKIYEDLHKENKRKKQKK